MEMKTQKPGKIAKVMKKAKGTARNIFYALLITGTMTSSLNNVIAQEKQLAFPANKGKKPDKPLVVKPNLSLKAFGRMYDGGKTTGLGIGVNYGFDIGTVSTGGSISLVNVIDGKTKVEEAGLWAGVPIGSLYAVGYVYQDLFFIAPAPTYGMNVSGYGVKLGGEVAPYKGANGFWLGYIKVPLGSGSLVPGVGIAGWGPDGWQGGPKKLVLTFMTSHKIGEKLDVSTETFYGKPFDGKGSLNFRITVSAPVL